MIAKFMFFGLFATYLLYGEARRSTVVDAPTRCYYSGRYYSVGSHINNGCNSCNCLPGGWACTKKSCQNRCFFDGKYLAPGTSYNDGCNDCACHGFCTLKACLGKCHSSYYNKYFDQGASMYDGCNWCICGSDGNFTCTKDCHATVPN